MKALMVAPMEPANLPPAHPEQNLPRGPRHVFRAAYWTRGVSLKPGLSPDAGELNALAVAASYEVPQSRENVPGGFRLS